MPCINCQTTHESLLEHISSERQRETKPESSTKVYNSEVLNTTSLAHVRDGLSEAHSSGIFGLKNNFCPVGWFSDGDYDCYWLRLKMFNRLPLTLIANFK